MDSSRLQASKPAVATAIFVLTFAVLIPVVINYRVEYDEGLWIAGGIRVAQLGHAPVFNFYTVAGPLTFYLQALIQGIGWWTPLMCARLWLAAEWASIGACIFLLVARHDLSRAVLGSTLWASSLPLLSIKHFVNHRWDSTMILMVALAFASAACPVIRRLAACLAAFSFGFTLTSIIPALAILSRFTGRKRSALLLDAFLFAATTGSIIGFEHHRGILAALRLYSTSYVPYLKNNLVFLFRSAPHWPEIFVALPFGVALAAGALCWKDERHLSIVTIAAGLSLFPRWSAENFIYVVPYAITALLTRTSRTTRTTRPVFLAALVLVCAILSLATMVRVYRTGEWVDIGGSKFHASSEDAASIRHLETIPAGSTFLGLPFSDRLISCRPRRAFRPVPSAGPVLAW